MKPLLGLILILLSSKTLANTKLSLDVDFSKPSNTKRLCVKQGSKDIYCTWVAHGSGSGNLYASKFSNLPNSYVSSLGNMKILGSYNGKHGISYRLAGLDKGKNDNILNRSIVIHSSDYIGYGKTGRSQGCFAIPIEDYRVLTKYLFTGMLMKVHV